MLKPAMVTRSGLHLGFFDSPALAKACTFTLTNALLKRTLPVSPSMATEATMPSPSKGWLIAQQSKDRSKSIHHAISLPRSRPLSLSLSLTLYLRFQCETSRARFGKSCPGAPWECGRESQSRGCRKRLRARRIGSLGGERAIVTIIVLIVVVIASITAPAPRYLSSSLLVCSRARRG